MIVRRTDVAWERRANWAPGWIAYGGRLRVEDGRLWFRAHRANVLKREWSVDLSDIKTVEVAARSPLALFAGGTRRRLRIVKNTGETALFVVPGVDEAVDQLRGVMDATFAGRAGRLRPPNEG